MEKANRHFPLTSTGVQYIPTCISTSPNTRKKGKTLCVTPSLEILQDKDFYYLSFPGIESMLRFSNMIVQQGRAFADEFGDLNLIPKIQGENPLPHAVL